MKRTINEIYDLINSKIRECYYELNEFKTDKKYLKGKITAYVDIADLIETSGVLEDGEQHNL